MYVIHAKRWTSKLISRLREHSSTGTAKTRTPLFEMVPLREPKFAYSNLPRGDVSLVKPVRQHRWKHYTSFSSRFNDTKIAISTTVPASATGIATAQAVTRPRSSVPASGDQLNLKATQAVI